MTHQVGIIGSGNWGSTVSKIIGQNVLKLPSFQSTVKMWVIDEVFEGEKLVDIINKKHENKKYLPGIILPDNVIAEPDLVKVVKESTHLIFVLPHQFLISTCDKIIGHIKPGTIAISLIKGLMDSETDLILSSEIIREKLNIHVSCLSGANIASEIAAEKLSTTTIGSSVPEHGNVWKSLFSKPYFIVTVVSFTNALEILGSVKNCIALGIGFLTALGYGANAKASAIRIGFTECLKFVSLFEPGYPTETFLESFALDDLIATCIGGRNVRAAEHFIRTNKSIAEVEAELLNGQKLQGPTTIVTVRNIIKEKKLEKDFPFLLYIYRVLFEKAEASSILNIFEH